MKKLISHFICIASLFILLLTSQAQTRLDKDGTLILEGKRRFILGCYHNPENLAELKIMAQNGINLVQCRPDPIVLDQARMAGLYGWVNTGANLDLSENSDEKIVKLQTMITSLKNHSGLAVWEAPDEAVWNLFYPDTEKKYYQENLAETKLDSLLKSYKQRSKSLAAGFKKGVQVLKKLDPQRPIWFNYAPRNSRAQLKPFSSLADIIGCDIYPVRTGHTGHSDLTNVALSCVGEYTDLMQATGPSKPVWMVLQAFSWEQLRINKPPQLDPMSFPSYQESRFMAYDAILHGAKGLLYWGSSINPSKAAFWQAILQVTREIADLEPYLVAADLKKKLKVEPVPFTASQPTRVAYTLRQWQNNYLLIVLPEDSGQYVRVSGLQQMNGRTFYDLGSERSYTVKNGRVLVSYQQEPHVLCTDSKYKKFVKNSFPDSWDQYSNHPLKENEQ